MPVTVRRQSEYKSRRWGVYVDGRLAEGGFFSRDAAERWAVASVGAVENAAARPAPAGARDESRELPGGWRAVGGVPAQSGPEPPPPPRWYEPLARQHARADPGWRCKCSACRAARRDGWTEADITRGGGDAGVQDHLQG